MENKTTLNFTEIYNEYYPSILTYLRTKIKVAEVREDIVCDIFGKVVRHLNTYNPERGKFNTWIYTVANNCVIDYYRKSSKETVNVITEADMVNSDGESNFDYVGNDTTDAEIENKELRHKIRRAMRNLRPVEKHVAILRLVKELDYNEISEILDMPLNSVKVTLLRAKENLQNQLKKEYASL